MCWIDPPAEASNIILVCGLSPWQKVCNCRKSSMPWPGHFLSSSLNRSQESYNDSDSPCVKLEISALFLMNLEIGKNLSKNLFSRSFQVLIVPGRVFNQSLALPVRVKGNSRTFFALSVTPSGCVVPQIIFRK